MLQSRVVISVDNVSMRFGSKLLFDEVTTSFLAGRRYGLTGPNGSGKSTFMKLLTGEQPPQKGDVTRPKKLGVLKQDQFAFDKFRVIDTVIMGNHRLWSALEERDFLYAKAEMTDADGMRLGELEGIVGEEDGYEAESNAAILLQGLDIPDELHHRMMSELQGGQKVRVLLAQALFGNPQALLLDEPTNHLDLDSIHWLRDFLVRYDGTLIVISHDRHFLNAVCTHTADIDYQTIITYTGGYDEMVMAKTQIRSRARIAERAARQEDRAAERLHRALLGRHALEPGAVAPQGSRAPADHRAGALEHSTPVHQVRDEPAVGPHRARVRERVEGVRRPPGLRRSSAAIISRGEKIVLVGTQRRRQDDDAEGAAVGCAGLRVTVGPRRRQVALGPRGRDRLLPAGPLPA